jgi:hypothetical protein
VTSKGIRELHRNTRHCLHMANRTSSAKLKTALLAHAQVLQRAQQEATQVVSTFAERWMQAALR